MPKVELSLTDVEITEFIFNGYLLCESLIDEELNARGRELPGARCEDLSRLIDDLLQTKTMQPVLRSLLGPDFTFSGNEYVHRNTGPNHSTAWHSDFRPRTADEPIHLKNIWVLYYPEDVSVQDGPTMVLPGSHLRIAPHHDALALYDNIIGQVSLAVPAGTVAFCHPAIWHRVGAMTTPGPRYMIKFYAQRIGAPSRCWRVDEESAGTIPPFAWKGYRAEYVNEEDYGKSLVRAESLWTWICGAGNAAARVE